MAADGYFRPDERVDLLDGEIVTMSAQSSPHAATVTAIQAVLAGAFGPGFMMRVRVPLALGDQCEPEPDLAVVAGGAWDDLKAHPATAGLVADVLPPA